MKLVIKDDFQTPPCALMQSLKILLVFLGITDAFPENQDLF